MKYLILLSIFLVGCRPEQVPTTYNIVVSPKAGATVNIKTDEDTPVLVNYEVKEDDESVNLTFDLVETPQNGTLSECKYLSKTQWNCLYTPNKNFHGNDKIGFKSRDGDFQSSDNGYIEISIASIPDKPLAGDDQEFPVVENTKVTFSVNNALDPDTEEKDITYTIVEGPKNGTLDNCFLSAGVVSCTYIPTPEYIGKDSFTYKVSDSEMKSGDEADTAIVHLKVLKEWIPVSGISSIKIEEKKSNVLIVFGLDISGSMTPYLDHMKKSVLNFVDDIQARGFKATLAFINSDADFITTEQKIQNPLFPDIEGAQIITKKNVSNPDSVKIFEIDAYDSTWNAATRANIAETKVQINSFIDGLPKGNDDERLLCSSIRFLNSNYTEKMDYVGLFTLANEDDAIKAGGFEKALESCSDKGVITYAPKEECTKSVACNYGDIGCEGRFKYNWVEHYTKNISSKMTGKCEYQQTVYKSVQETWSKGYISQTIYTYENQEVCKDEYKNADNPSGCRIESVKVANGTKQVMKYRKGDCTVNSALANCQTYQKIVSVEDGKVTALKSCTKYGGTCETHPEIVQDCTMVREAYVSNRTRNKTSYSSTDKTCLEVTGGNTCTSITWSGAKVVTLQEGCGLNKSSVLSHYETENGAEKSLASAISNYLKKSYKKSVYVGVANDLELNNKAFSEASSESLTLPSVDCSGYNVNRTIYEGIDGVEFKKLANLMGESGEMYSICSPKKYPSDKLDVLVEDAQSDFKIEEYSNVDMLKVEEVKLVYASSQEKILTKGDYSYDKGHITLNNPNDGKNLVEMKVKYSGYKY